MAAHTIPAKELSPLVFVTEEEYLRTIYEPDCDYVDGVVEERNSGEVDHSEVQSAVLSFFRARAPGWACGPWLNAVCRLRRLAFGCRM